MTFLNIVNELKQKYHPTSDVVIFETIFKLSKKVKNKVDFATNRNQNIDFRISKISKYLDDYFLKKKPLGQILKTTKFCGLNITIFKNIFEPRSETELITEDIIKYLYKNKQLINGVDLCCGTGCMGLTIKKLCPWVNMTLIDIQKKAIFNTKCNAKLNNLNVKTYVGDFYKTLISHELKFDFIVCNPPYVDIKTLDKSMIKYENKISFTNSDDPQYFYDQLIKNKNKILNKNGKLFFETNKYQLLII